MVRPCDSCRKPYTAKRPNSRFCCESCRKRKSRAPKPPVAVLVPAEGELTVVTRSELEAAGRVGSAVGQAALLIAKHLDAGAETGSSVAALVREHRATLGEALRGVKVAGDPLDELRALRDRKRTG